MEDIQEQIKLLVELQGLDTQIFKLVAELESIPQRIKQAEENFKEKADNLKNLEDNLKRIQVKRKEKEGDLESKEGAIKKYQSQLNQVKTNREYSALQDEISRVKADNSLIEEDIIGLLDQIDAENQKMAKEKEFLKQEETQLAKDRERLVGEEGKIKIALDDLKNQRVVLAEKIDKEMLFKYERIVKKGDNRAVVPVLNYACQGCFRVMPAQVINEIRMHDRLIFCENCARILYIEE